MVLHVPVGHLCGCSMCLCMTHPGVCVYQWKSDNNNNKTVKINGGNSIIVVIP